MILSNNTVQIHSVYNSKNTEQPFCFTADSISVIEGVIEG